MTTSRTARRARLVRLARWVEWRRVLLTMLFVLATATLLACAAATIALAEPASPAPSGGHQVAQLEQNDLGPQGGPTRLLPNERPRGSLLGPDWRATLGLGGLVTPAYTGSVNEKVRPLPYLDLSWRDRLFVSTTNGAGAYVVKGTTYRIGVSLNVSPDRWSGEDSRLHGLRSVSTGAEAKVFLDYTLGAVTYSAAVRERIGYVNGPVVDLGATWRVPTGSRLFVTLGPSVTWASRSWVRGFFGVTADEASRARARGNPLDPYAPSSSVRDVSLNANAGYRWSEHWGVGGLLKVSYLVGQAGHSPITRQKVQPLAGVFVSYSF